ncbi:MAG: hypothetical protein ACFFGZ_11435 [Candidatus Thorarchaeota archaeon]
MKCPQCKGSGQIQQYQTIPGIRRQARRGTMTTLRCPTCQGTGEIHKRPKSNDYQAEDRYGWMYKGFLGILIVFIIFVWIMSR